MRCKPITHQQRRKGWPIGISIVNKTCLALICFAMAGEAWSLPIYNDGHGKEWLQLTDSSGLSWNDVDSVCANDGATACTGSVGGVDISGWVWADNAQVATLFSYFLPTGEPQFDPAINGYVYADFTTNSEALAFFSAFTPQWMVDTAHEVAGWTNSSPNPLEPDPFGYAAIVYGVSDSQQTSEEFAVAGNVSTDATVHADSIGAWLWRPDIQSVPEPSVLSLIGLGVLGLAGLRRQRRDSTPFIA